MLLITALCLHVAIADKSSIDLRDHDFIGEDKQIAAKLTNKMTQQTDIEPQPRGYDTKILELELLNEFEFRYGHLKNKSQNGRRQFDKDPKDDDLKNITLNMQQQAIYAVELRYKEIGPTMKKYGEHPYFRISYIFAKLDEWQNDMHVIYSVVKNMTEKHILVYTPERKFRVLRFIFYYEHCVRKNVDVTYTIEHLLDLHKMIKHTAGLESEEGPQI